LIELLIAITWRCRLSSMINIFFNAYFCIYFFKTLRLKNILHMCKKCKKVIPSAGVIEKLGMSLFFVMCVGLFFERKKKSSQFLKRYNFSVRRLVLHWTELPFFMGERVCAVLREFATPAPYTVRR
jgi:hypothetical protein